MASLGTPLCLKGVSSLAAYRAYGETQALVPGVVYEGEPTLLAGAAGCNKTTMAMQIAAALTKPEALVPLPWGPRTGSAGVPGLVVYLDFEKRGKLSEERARSMGLDMRDVKWLESPMLTDERGHLYNDGGKPQEKLERLIGILRGFAGEEVVKMIVLDSWRYLVNTFLGYNENSFVDCTLVWDAVRAVCKEENCAMLVIAHFKKLDTRDRDHTELMLGLDLTRIRKTEEQPPRISILDLIGAVCKVVNPRKTWSDLRKSHREVVSESYSVQLDYKFEGIGQNGTPVTNARGAILIIELLPGNMAANFRAVWSDIIARYLGGDAGLAEEVERNRVIQEHASDDNPLRVFGQTVEIQNNSKVARIGGIPTEQFKLAVQGNDKILSDGLIDPRNPQVYAGIPRQIWLPPTIPHHATIIKFGYTTDSAQRVGVHRESYGGFEYLNTFHCANAYGAEQRFRDFLIMKGRLITGIRLNGTQDTELFWVLNQEEWEEFVNVFKQICEDMISEYCQTERETLQLRLSEIELERDRERTKQSIEETKRSVEVTKRDEEKTKQINAVEKTKQVEAEAKARIAEAEARRGRWGMEMHNRRGLSQIANEEVGPVQEISAYQSSTFEIEEADGGNDQGASGTRSGAQGTGESDISIPTEGDLPPDEANPHGHRSAIVLRPARRRQPALPTDVQDFPYQVFLDIHLEPEQDMDRGLQWKDLKVRFQEWHAREFQGERVNKSFPKSIQDYFSSKLGGWHDTSRAGVKVKGFFGWRLRDLSQVTPDEGRVVTVSQGPPEISRNTSSPPLSGNAVQRAERDIVRILDEIEGTNRELSWGDLVARRNPLINERAMVRGRVNMLAQRRLFKRPVMGNTCVYSLC